ncbi:MAG: restriction endonuclease subunit S [Anaerolineaceae bacterium]|nr:restriction endonuclease subunit S [Anaerolineaceae bacterium]
MKTGWPITKLGNIAEFRNGINYNKDNAGVGIKVIGVGDFQNYTFPRFDTLSQINPEGIVSDDDYLQENDIIFVRSNGNKKLIGRSLLIKGINEKVTFSGFTIRLRFTSNELLPIFYAYLFQSSLIRHALSHQGGGTNISNLNQQILKNLNVPVPRLAEQRKIAEILGTWDEAIAQVAQLTAALQQRKKGLMQRLLTGQVRFPEFEGKRPGKRETKFGTIPADWDYKPIGAIAKSVSKKNDKAKELPVLSCTKYDGLVDSLEYFGRQIFPDDTSSYKVVSRNQFAYATNHIEEGSIGYQDLYEEALISPMYTVFQTNSSINDAFLYRVLKTELYRHIFETRTTGTVDRRGSLRWNEFSQIAVPIPSLLSAK